ncbi:MAG TPA: hypothetical protein VK753_10505 [Xanthomonadaceae bacterium]|jgi:hypothetical protein|nr:hypothetical protein [Xanthomonadaceae bacterium]
MNRLLMISAAATLLSFYQPAHADTLLVDRAQMAASVARPMHGMSMAKVEQRFGAPTEKLDPRGGQRPQWPVIERWQYPQYTVYFAHGHVVDIVLNHATPEEIGPAPAR